MTQQKHQKNTTAEPNSEINSTTQEDNIMTTFTKYTEVLHQALQALRKKAYRDKEGNLCIGVASNELRSIPGLDNVDGNDLIIHPLMYLGYLRYKGTYWHEFDDQAVEEFILQETEDLGQWDVGFMVSDFAGALREA
jgi:hypothetical protein